MHQAAALPCGATRLGAVGAQSRLVMRSHTQGGRAVYRSLPCASCHDTMRTMGAMGCVTAASSPGAHRSPGGGARCTSAVPPGAPARCAMPCRVRARCVSTAVSAAPRCPVAQVIMRGRVRLQTITLTSQASALCQHSPEALWSYSRAQKTTPRSPVNVLRHASLPVRSLSSALEGGQASEPVEGEGGLLGVELMARLHGRRRC